jgi:hypothetical protein
MFAPDGRLVDDGLQRLFESLRDRYCRGDVVDELLVELAVTDYWRLQKGLEYEVKYLTPQGGEFHPQGGMSTLVRYMTANRRAFDKSLQMLVQMREQKETERELVEDDSQSADTDSPSVLHGGGRWSSLAVNAIQEPAESSGLDQGAEEENGVPEAEDRDGEALPRNCG